MYVCASDLRRTRYIPSRLVDERRGVVDSAQVWILSASMKSIETCLCVADRESGGRKA